MFVGGTKLGIWLGVNRESLSIAEMTTLRRRSLHAALWLAVGALAGCYDWQVGGAAGDVCEGMSSCDRSCAEGGCTFRCDSMASCSFSCAGGGCTFVCAPSSSCSNTCAGGNCTFDCAGTASCDNSCAGGGCNSE